MKNLKTKKLKNIKVNTFLFFSFLVFQVFSFSVLLHAQTLSSTELINNAKQYDGQVIVYSGEVIGDVMLRKDYAWVNINDGANAIGVWMSAFLAKQINFRGSYKSRGDTLEITGIFHRACLEHGGDLDIHAQGLNKIASGRLIMHRVDLGKRNLSFILLAILFLIWILILFRRK